jgi:hypothetical protein
MYKSQAGRYESIAHNGINASMPGVVAKNRGLGEIAETLLHIGPEPELSSPSSHVPRVLNNDSLQQLGDVVTNWAASLDDENSSNEHFAGSETQDPDDPIDGQAGNLRNGDVHMVDADETSQVDGSSSNSVPEMDSNRVCYGMVGSSIYLIRIHVARRLIVTVCNQPTTNREEHGFRSTSKTSSSSHKTW